MSKYSIMFANADVFLHGKIVTKSSKVQNTEKGYQDSETNDIGSGFGFDLPTACSSSTDKHEGTW